MPAIDDKGCDGISAAPGKPLENRGILAGLFEAFASARLAGSKDSIPMKIPLPPETANQLLSHNRLAPVCATQRTRRWQRGHLAAVIDFLRRTLIAKLSSTKKTAMAAFLAHSGFQERESCQRSG
jgi:hypothetical protein